MNNVNKFILLAIAALSASLFAQEDLTDHLRSRRFDKPLVFQQWLSGIPCVDAVNLQRKVSDWACQGNDCFDNHELLRRYALYCKKTFRL